MAQKFAINPQTLVIGNITLQFAWLPTDPSQCMVIASASGAQAQTTVLMGRNGSNVIASAATVAADLANSAIAQADANVVHPGV